MAKAKKAKQAEKKARVAEKQERKATKKDKKVSKKAKDEMSDGDDDVDLDDILADYARQQEQFMKVTETVEEEPPTARVSATFVGSPASSNELFLFGGESFDGTYARFYNDLFVYSIKHDRWSRVTSGNAPLPRSGHAWCRGGNSGGIYLFGGEFSSPKQGTFYHYKDFWHLDPATREWTRLEGKGKGPSPPARSGHRMTYFKNYIILFGGFQDTSAQTKYLSDLWIYDCQRYTWHQPVLPPGAGKPDARSSFTLLPHDSGAVLFGGYSREKAVVPTKSTKRTGLAGATRVTTKPVVHQDTWFLRITPPGPDGSADAAPTVRWERRKRPVNQPNPARLGATMAFHKGRGILFGGVHDVAETDETIESEFFNQLFAWNVDRNRFQPLTLRRPRVGKKAESGHGAVSRRDRAKANDEELLKNLAALELKAAQNGADSMADLGLDSDHEDPNIGDEEDTDDADKPAPKPVQYEFPHARFNASLAVQGDVLYIFGGTIEAIDREHTFSDMWAVDLAKLDGVKQIFAREMPEGWDKADDSSDDDEDDEDDDGDEEESEDGEDANAGDDESEEGKKRGADRERDSKKKKEQDRERERAEQAESKGRSEQAQPDEPDRPVGEADEGTAPTDDTRPQPRPFETLREFYARTALQWQNIVLSEFGPSDPSSQPGVGDAAAAVADGGRDEQQQHSAVAAYLQSKSVKELRKDAFARAEGRWWDCREEIHALEEEQLDAGIGDVVNLGPNNGGAGGAGGGGGGTAAGVASGARRR